MLKKLFVITITITSGPLLGMISYNHTETDNEQRVFTVGDVHTLDQVTEPGFSQKLMTPLLRVVKEIKPAMRLAVILEMNPDFLRTGKASVVAPLCQELVALYRTLLQRPNNPLFLKLVDDRSVETEFAHGLSGQISDILGTHISPKNIGLFSTRPKLFKENKQRAAAILAALQRFKQPNDKIPSIQKYLESLEQQQAQLIAIAERWKEHEKVAAYLAKAVATHKEGLEGLRDRLKAFPLDTQLWIALITPFLTKTTSFGLLSCYDEFEA